MSRTIGHIRTATFLARAAAFPIVEKVKPDVLGFLGGGWLGLRLTPPFHGVVIAGKGHLRQPHRDWLTDDRATGHRVVVLATGNGRSVPMTDLYVMTGETFAFLTENYWTRKGEAS